MNQRITDSVELFKNLVLLRFWNANSVVNHFQLDGTVFAIEINIQEFIFLRVLQGVVDQIQQGAGNRFAVNFDRRNIV